MRGTEILSWLLLLKPLFKNRKAQKAMDAVPEVMAFRERFKGAYADRLGMALTVDEVQRIGRAMGLGD